jgi:ubiquinone/menaquinone biosynthesis C-methylase UbiE
MDSIHTIWKNHTIEYQQYRPEIPNELCSFLLAVLKTSKANCVVDLGSGTGISSRAWANYANKVIGIEISEEMITTAQQNTRSRNVQYINASSAITNLPDSSADIVVSSSAIHWMNPLTTLPEIKRIIKPQGIFAFWGTSQPPVTPFPELDNAYIELVQKVNELGLYNKKPVQFHWDDWKKNIQNDGHFSTHRYFYLHQTVQWNSNHYIEWLKTTMLRNYVMQNESADINSIWSSFCGKILNFFGKETHTLFFVYPINVFKPSII